MPETRAERICERSRTQPDERKRDNMMNLVSRLCTQREFRGSRRSEAVLRRITKNYLAFVGGKIELRTEPPINADPGGRLRPGSRLIGALCVRIALLSKSKETEVKLSAQLSHIAQGLSWFRTHVR